MWTEKYLDRLTRRQANLKTDKHIDRLTVKHTYSNRHIDKPIEIERKKEKVGETKRNLLTEE